MATITVDIRRQLRQYTKLEASHVVCVALDEITTYPDGSTVTRNLPDVYPTDAALQAAAAAAGRSTWDEDTICAVCDCERGPQPVVVHPPEPPPVV